MINSLLLGANSISANSLIVAPCWAWVLFIVFKPIHNLFLDHWNYELGMNSFHTNFTLCLFLFIIVNALSL